MGLFRREKERFYKMSKISTRTIDEIIKFSMVVDKNALSNERKNWGKSVEFECPLCNGTITCVRSTYNGHIHAKCSGCNFTIME